MTPKTTKNWPEKTSYSKTYEGLGRGSGGGPVWLGSKVTTLGFLWGNLLREGTLISKAS